MSRRAHILFHRRWPTLRVDTRGGRRAAVMAVLSLGMLVSCLVPRTAVAEEPGREALLKAAFLYRFVGFVDWPEVEGAQEGAIRIGVLGEDPFGATIDEVFSEEDRRGHRFLILRSKNAEDLIDCRIVFVNLDEDEASGDSLSPLLDRPILLVGHQEGFAARGGHVNFFVEQERLRFEVNLAAVQDSGLRMSSRLLALARIVKIAR